MQNWHWLDIGAIYLICFPFFPPFVCAFRVCLCVRAVEMWQSWFRSFLRLRLELNGTTLPVLNWFISSFTPTAELQAQWRISRSDSVALTTKEAREKSSSGAVTDTQQQQSGRRVGSAAVCTDTTEYDNAAGCPSKTVNWAQGRLLSRWSSLPFDLSPVLPESSLLC